ncbi:12714_t:CDS:2 [Acaulospora colombiana]|uniref:12714_t:CDS:1 n=1 Tax=Acaulospora colombiana TaxID=27376 RepID=A0ACA9L3I8_9GLOM|nr:12714_t:CDS:2 [Acaulospora colombiana]
MVAACRTVPSNAHKEINSCTEKIKMSETRQLQNEVETNVFAVPISTPNIVQNSDTAKVAEIEEKPRVNNNENVSAATSTRRSLRNASKIVRNTTSIRDSAYITVNNVEPAQAETTTPQEHFSPLSTNRRGPGRPRKSIVFEGIETSSVSTNVSHVRGNTETSHSSLPNGSTLRIKFAKVGPDATTTSLTTPVTRVPSTQPSVVVASSSPLNFANALDTPANGGPGIPTSNVPTHNNDTTSISSISGTPVKRGPGRPRKNPLPPNIQPSLPSNNDSSARQSERKRKVTENRGVDSYPTESERKGNKRSTEKESTPRKRSKTDFNSEESFRKNKSSEPTEKKKSPLEELREKKITEKEAELVKVVDDHDSLIRELYYMESYHLLLNNLDPQTIKQDNSERMVKYLASHNLWSTLNDQVVNIQSNSKRMSTRHSLTKHRETIVNMLQKSVGSRGFNVEVQPDSVSWEPGANTRGSRRTSRTESSRNREITFAGGLSSYSLRRRGHAQFSSLKDYLESFVTLDEEDITPAEEELRAQNEAELQYRIWVLKNEGRLNKVSKPALEPPRSKVHWDYLLDAVTQHSKYMNKLTEAKFRITRQISKAVSQHFFKLANQGSRERKLEEKRIKKLAKTTANLVKQKWKTVESIVLAKHKELLREEQEREGKRHLNLLIEHSTQMLEVQQNELLGTRSKRIRKNFIDTNVKLGNTYEECDDLEKYNTEDSEFEVDKDSPDYDRMSHSCTEEAEVESSDDDEIRDLQDEKDLPLEDLLEKYDYPICDEERAVKGNKKFVTDVSGECAITSLTDKNSDLVSSESSSHIKPSKSVSPSISFNGQADITNDTKRGRLRARTSSREFKLDTTVQDPYIDDKEFMMSPDQIDEDHESSLDEQELEENSEEEALELDELENESKLPIEELLKRYSCLPSDNAGVESETDEVETTMTIVANGDAKSYNEDEDFRSEVKSNSESCATVENAESNGKCNLEDSFDGTALNKDVGQHDVEESIDRMDIDEDFTTKLLIAEPNEITHKEENKFPNDETRESENVSNPAETTKGPEPPTGTTLSTTNVRTQIPPLLRGKLREYQHVGLDWLASLYNNGLNGILADEMGLGKTIQTIALLAHLAFEKGDWGPHLIVVPTSVIINWEMEFKKWCPGFIILTYYGSPKERREKRIGWMKEHTFHVCITSYHLVVLDQVVFKKKKWHYLILDEAHNIKNFQSQRWKTLLNFNSERRLLLTGTPLQNNLMELWSLLYFLMPNGVSGDMPLGFANQKEFQEWFSRPVDRMIENNEQFDDETLSAVQKLHTVLRPYLLRRLKSDVEKQLPAKHHHIIKCRLSKRQRFLYDDFMSRAKTKETLQSGNFLSIINCLMQLRKVCNHPDLFEVRPIRTSFAMSKSVLADYEISEFVVRRNILRNINRINMLNVDFLNLVPIQFENDQSMITSEVCWELNSEGRFLERIKNYDTTEEITDTGKATIYNSFVEFGKTMELRARLDNVQRWSHMRYINSFRLKRRPIYGSGLYRLCRQLGTTICSTALVDANNPRKFFDHTKSLTEMIVSYERRYNMMEDIIKQYAFVTPAVVARDVASYALAGLPEEMRLMIYDQVQDLYHPIRVKLQVAFPDKRLLQYDCGKLQELDVLLRKLKENGRRALIFTQMTRVLDILEIFLNIHGHRYLRLDGATKIEQRQLLTERFNHDPKILVFILSTRSGGLGINLTGADSVIFYDSDWNPCMDRQCQDRCHRIGQTREVNIYRFVSEYTIEENMLQKANQKRLLDKMVITDGEFTTDYFQKMDWRELVSDIAPHRVRDVIDEPSSGVELEQCLAEVEDATDVNAAKVARNEMDLDLTDFADTDTPAESSAARRASSVSTAPSPRMANEMVETGDETPDHVDYYMLRFMERELELNVGFGGLPDPEENFVSE